MKKTIEGNLPKRDIAVRESRVLNHFLTTKPKPHKPLGKTSQAKRRSKERKAHIRIPTLPTCSEACGEQPVTEILTSSIRSAKRAQSHSKQT